MFVTRAVFHLETSPLNEVARWNIDLLVWRQGVVTKAALMQHSSWRPGERLQRN
jgi:hypothetical protein